MAPVVPLSSTATADDHRPRMRHAQSPPPGDTEGAAGSNHYRSVELLVEEHLALADHLALKYVHRGVDLDDLVQVARLALLLAAQRYRPAVGVSFTAFAVPTIRGELKRHFRDHAWFVRPPRRVQELSALARAARDHLEQRGGHTPSAAEVAGWLNVDLTTLAECDEANSSYTAISLDAGTPNHTLPLAERLADPASEIDNLADVISLRLEVSRLTRGERRILRWRFVDGLTQREIGQRLGISQMQVSRTLSRTIHHLRGALDPEVPQAS